MLESVMGFIVPLGMLFVALLVLLFSAERLVVASEDVGVSLGVPPFILGLTILAVGTSLPELVTGLFAVSEGSGEIVAGTVLGSNIANILLILGFSAVYAKEFEIDWDLMHGDIPILFGSLMLIGFFIYPLSAQDLQHYLTTSEQVSNGIGKASSRAVITVPEGVLLLSGYVLYLYYYSRQAQRTPEAFHVDLPAPHPLTWKTLAWIIAGLIGVPIGAHYTVRAAVDIADLLLVGKEVVAASMISVGTSLPELVVSYSAVRRRNFEMALGNVTGSNIFNTFVVMGVPGMLAPLLGNRSLLPVGEDSILFLQMPYYAATVIVFLVIVLDKKLTRTEGLMILLAYVVFIAKLYGFF
jgi:cation:H+ antiporter